MKTYVQRPVKVKAEQFLGHDKEHVALIEKIVGSTGYNGRLGYIKNKYNVMITIRPKEWVVEEEGKDDFKIMNDQEFNERYMDPDEQVDEGEKVDPGEETVHTGTETTVKNDEDNADPLDGDDPDEI